MMRITRRGLFATIAAAFIPAKAGVPLALMRKYDRTLIKCHCLSCQWARGMLSRGGYEWYPYSFALIGPKIGDMITVRKPLRPLINPES